VYTINDNFSIRDQCTNAFGFEYVIDTYFRHTQYECVIIREKNKYPETISFRSELEMNYSIH
jgi:hypothetical protein